MADYSPVIACDEVFGTSQEDGSYTTGTAKVQLRCTWANRRLLASDLLYGTDGTPRQWPSNSSLYCTQVSVKPELTKYTASGQEIIYEHAILDVSYAIPGNQGGGGGGGVPMDPINLYSETLTPYTRVMTLGPSGFEWTSDGAALKSGEEPGKVIHGMRLTRHLFSVAAISSTILDLPGSVHNATYQSQLLGLTFAANTLLFIPPELSRTVTGAGASAWDLKLSWDYQKDEWNKVWRKDTETFDSISHIGGGVYKSYPEKSHSAFLF